TQITTPITNQDLLVQLMQEFIAYLITIFEGRPLVMVTCCVLKKSFDFINAHCDGQTWTPGDILEQDRQVYFYDSLNDADEIANCRNQTRVDYLVSIVADTVRNCDG